MQKSKVEIASHLTLIITLLFSIYMATYAWFSSKESGAGAAQGDLGFYLSLKVITPILLVVVSIPFIWGLYVSHHTKNALLTLVSYLTYANLLVVSWCWIYVFYFWY